MSGSAVCNRSVSGSFMPGMNMISKIIRNKKDNNNTENAKGYRVVCGNTNRNSNSKHKNHAIKYTYIYMIIDVYILTNLIESYVRICTYHYI
ncbi:hypothetical protein T492DRAFT_1008658, partial [Pavlovales sp. CCMP2436]